MIIWGRPLLLYEILGFKGLGLGPSNVPSFPRSLILWVSGHAPSLSESSALFRVDDLACPEISRMDNRSVTVFYLLIHRHLSDKLGRRPKMKLSGKGPQNVIQ